MMKAVGLKNMLPDLGDVLKRFSVAALMSLCLAVLVNSAVANSSSDASVMDYVLDLTAAFLAAGIGHLFAEGRKWSRGLNLMTASVGAAIAGGLMGFYTLFQTSEMFLMGGLVLLLMIAAYLRRNAEHEALWLFNMKLALAVIFAGIVAIVFGAGLSAVVAGLNFLLDTDIPNNAYGHIWATACTLVAPLYGLSLMPDDLDDEIEISAYKGTIVERAMSIVSNYVLVPLAIVYALIQHAYALKIMIGGSLPKGEIGTIVSLFAAGGTATWLLAWPWREKGTRLLRFFMKGWFWFLPVPIVLLVIAVWRRVSDYGVTPDRYAIALVALWAMIVFAYLLWRKQKADLRVLVGSAAVLLLAACFGPHGAYGVTARDQMGRLTAMLEKAGVISNGKFVRQATDKDLANGDAFSIMQALGQVHALDQAWAWLGKPAPKAVRDRFSSYDNVAELAKALGINSVYNRPSNSVFISRYALSDVKLSGPSRLIGPINILGLPAAASSNKDMPSDVVTSTDKTMFRLRVGTHESVMPIGDMMKRLKAAEVTDGVSLPLLNFELDSKVTLLIQSAYGQTGDEPELSSIYGWIVVRE